MIVTATQIKLNGLFSFFRFIPRVGKIKRQLENIEGLIFIKFSGFSTLSGWESREAMQAFRNSGEHLDAMKNIRRMGKAKSVTWETESEPDWTEAMRKLSEVKF